MVRKPLLFVGGLTFLYTACMKPNPPILLLGSLTFIVGTLYASRFGFTNVEAEVIHAGEIFRSMGILALLLGFFYQPLLKRSTLWQPISALLATIIAIMHLPPLFLWLTNAPVTDGPTIFTTKLIVLYPLMHALSILCFIWMLRIRKTRSRKT